MIKKNIIIGTRGSTLALVQAREVLQRLEAACPDYSFDIKKIKTTGDKILNTPLAQIGGKGLFLKEIEEALLAGEIDLAVHSMKDVPAELPEGLEIGAVLKREDVRDVFISEKHKSILGLPKKARVGTSSLRRKAQLKNFRPDLEIIPLRGNVDTRLKKIKTEKLDGIILAAAGMIRLKNLPASAEFLDPKVMLPAVAQGAVGIEIRSGDEDVKKMIAGLNDEESFISVSAERAFMKKMEGGCQVPIAALAELKGGVITITAVVADVEGRALIRDQVRGDKDDAVRLGSELGGILLSRGGKDIVRSLNGYALSSFPRKRESH